MIKRFLNWLFGLGETRENKVLRTCGCICYCPQCRDILNDQAECRCTGRSSYVYECKSCGHVSHWDFGHLLPFVIPKMTERP